MPLQVLVPLSGDGDGYGPERLMIGDSPIRVISHTDADSQLSLDVEVGQTSLTCKLQKVCSVAETDASFDALIANAVGGLGKRMARWVGEKWIACELVDHVSKCLAG